MGIDYYSCCNCGEVYNDYGDYYNCGECWSGFCCYCGEKELVKKYGIWDEESENPDDFDKDGYLKGEEGSLKSCPICTKDKVDYEELAKFLSRKAGYLSVKEAWKEYIELKDGDYQ